MNVLAPIKTIMTTNLITVNPGDKLTKVKEIFDENNIHHIPVVRFKEMVGLISKSDFNYFLRGFSRNEEDRFINYARLRAYTAEDIMTKGLVALYPETDALLKREQQRLIEVKDRLKSLHIAHFSTKFNSFLFCGF